MSLSVTSDNFLIYNTGFEMCLTHLFFCLLICFSGNVQDQYTSNKMSHFEHPEIVRSSRINVAQYPSIHFQYYTNFCNEVNFFQIENYDDHL